MVTQQFSGVVGRPVQVSLKTDAAVGVFVANAPEKIDRGIDGFGYLHIEPDESALFGCAPDKLAYAFEGKIVVNMQSERPQFNRDIRIQLVIRDSGKNSSVMKHFTDHVTGRSGKRWQMGDAARDPFFVEIASSFNGPSKTPDSLNVHSSQKLTACDGPLR